MQEGHRKPLLWTVQHFPRNAQPLGQSLEDVLELTEPHLPVGRQPRRPFRQGWSRNGALTSSEFAMLIRSTLVNISPERYVFASRYCTSLNGSEAGPCSR